MLNERLEAGMHPPAAQIPVHARPQAPQWALLVRVSVSQPLATLPSQSPKPALQAVIAHALARQSAVALARVHARPHAPQ